jgi:hypothetical protein
MYQYVRKILRIPKIIRNRICTPTPNRPPIIPPLIVHSVCFDIGDTIKEVQRRGR